MDSPHGPQILDHIETEFNKLLKNPEIYIEPQPEKTHSFKLLCEKSYGSAFRNNNKIRGKFLSKLLVDNFDEEQIWQQSDLLNKAVLANISQAIQDIEPQNIISSFSKPHHPKTSVKKDKKISQKIKNKFSYEENETFAFDDDNSSNESNAEEYAFDDDSDFPSELEDDTEKVFSSQQKLGQKFEDDESLSELDEDIGESFSSEKKLSDDFEDDDENLSETEEDSKKVLPFQKKLSYRSEVDDKFFKLSELENFLRIEDLKEERGIVDSNSLEDEIYLFQDIPSDGMDDLDEKSDNKEKSSRDIMYKHFFDDPESEVRDQGDSNMYDDEYVDKSVEIPNTAADMETENVSDTNTEKKRDSENYQKTAFELEQEKIKKKILECEKNMLQPLPWHLTGEVEASSRPVNSLIRHEAEFDVNAKQDLVIDKALTERVEEITKMAIRNKAFSDVERKYKPTEEIITYKKEVALDQKNKKSLAEVYEEDYLKKQNKQDEEEENPKHKEIKKLMDSLFPQLHALFSHIPKPAVPEMKIVSNLPAVAVEEVAPTSVSDATLLAPEEVKRKSGLIKGKTERTDTDRKRERRKKKVHQRLKGKRRNEKLEALKANPSARISGLEKIETLKKLKQHRNTRIAKVDEAGKIKSSKDFFSRLQDTVTSKNTTGQKLQRRK